MRHWSAIGVALLALAGATRATAGSNDERQVTWEGLSAVVGREVRIVMPDGALIQGKAAALEPDGLAIEIRKTSNRKNYPKGRYLAPRAILHAVDVFERPTLHWRLIGTAVGGGLGYPAARGARNLAKASRTAGALGLGALAAGLPLTGYLLGRAGDRRLITYVIAP